MSQRIRFGMNGPGFPPAVVEAAHRREGEFLEHVLPAVVRAARNRFRGYPPFKFEERVQDAQGLAWKAFVRLIRQGGDPREAAGTIAQRVCKSAARGESIAPAESLKDPLARRREDVEVNSDIRYLNDLATDRVSVGDEVAFRLDFEVWRSTWDELHQGVMHQLAIGCTPEEVRARTGLTKGQLEGRRAKMHRTWQQFQGEA